MSDADPIRILHVLPFSGMGGGAPNAMLTTLAEQQKRRPTWVVSLREGDFAQEARKTGATVTCAFPGGEWPKSRIRRWIQTVRAVRRAAREYRVDLIHNHSAPGNRYCYPASRLTGVPLISHQRDTYKPDHFHAWVRRTDWIIAISEWVKTNLPADLQKKISVVNDAVGIPPDERIVWPKQEGRLVMGMAGRCVPEKGMDLLIDAALALCPKYDFDVEVWGFQEGPGAEFATALREKVRQSPFENRFRFEGFRSDMENFYRRMDIVVVPSRVLEGFGLTAAEGQAWGKAVIAAGHGGLAEIVEHEVSGLKFQPHDAQSLREQLERILSDPNLRTRLARIARESAIRRFSPAMHADRIDAVYHQVLQTLGRSKQK